MTIEMIEVEEFNQGTQIKVIGVGGGGGNAVAHMMERGVQGVQFVCANTDAQALQRSSAQRNIQLGLSGLGAGSKPEKGREAAEAAVDEIRAAIDGAHMLFITAGMGGGTGTGAAPVIAEIARELEILTVAVVTKPFPHEGKKRLAVAQDGIRELQQHVDSLILIPNEKLRLVLGGNVTLLSGFKAANDVLQNAVQGISDLITRPGMMNVDFADVKTVMANRGMAMMGLGAATGEDRAKKAVEAALSSPLLDDLELTGARGILVNITCDESLTLDELELVNERINEIASAEVDMKCGTSFDPALSGELRVTVVATGLEGSRAAAIAAKAKEAMPEPRLKSPGVVTPLRTPSAWPGRGHDVEIPAQPQRHARPAAAASLMALDYNEELLDIPAFLRAQAD